MPALRKQIWFRRSHLMPLHILGNDGTTCGPHAERHAMQNRCWCRHGQGLGKICGQQFDKAFICQAVKWLSLCAGSHAAQQHPATRGGAAGAAAGSGEAERLRGRRARAAAQNALLGLHRCLTLRVCSLSSALAPLLEQQFSSNVLCNVIKAKAARRCRCAASLNGQDAGSAGARLL